MAQSLSKALMIPPWYIKLTQIFVVLAGTVQVQVNKTTFTVGQGSHFFVPRGRKN